MLYDNDSESSRTMIMTNGAQRIKSHGANTVTLALMRRIFIWVHRGVTFKGLVLATQPKVTLL